MHEIVYLFLTSISMLYVPLWCGGIVYILIFLGILSFLWVSASIGIILSQNKIKS